jgi:hypothetical protein
MTTLQKIADIEAEVREMLMTDPTDVLMHVYF